MNPTKWLERYIYTDIHEIFFCEFLVLLYEWLLKLASQRKKIQEREPTEWNPQLKIISNPISRAVDFWVDSIFEGYITEFVVNTVTSYSEVERKFFQGNRGRYLTYLRIWIKMLYVRKGS